MKKLLTIIFSVVSFSALAAYQAGPMTTNKAAAYATTGQAPVFNGTQWVFVNTNTFGGGTATATNAIGNSNGLGTNTSLFGNVGIGTTNPSHTLHVVTGTNNAVGVDSTGTDSSSMFHIHNYAGTQGPFFDFGAPPGRWGFGMSSVGSFNLRFTQDTNTDPVNGTTLVVFSTNGVITGDGSGLTNIPGSAIVGGVGGSSATVTLSGATNFLFDGGYGATNYAIINLTNTTSLDVTNMGDRKKYVFEFYNPGTNAFQVNLSANFLIGSDITGIVLTSNTCFLGAISISNSPTASPVRMVSVVHGGGTGY